MDIINILIGGGILAFIEFLIKRYDSRHDKQGEILSAISKLSGDVAQVKEDADRRDAILSRTHILRFRDELYNNMKHTSEYFEQTIDDIVVYERYCDTHPDFRNGRTTEASQFIREEYRRLFKEHKL